MDGCATWSFLCLHNLFGFVLDWTFASLASILQHHFVLCVEPRSYHFFFLADVMYMYKEHEDISKMGEQLTALAFDLREMYFF